MPNDNDAGFVLEDIQPDGKETETIDPLVREARRQATATVAAAVISSITGLATVVSLGVALYMAQQSSLDAKRSAEEANRAFIMQEQALELYTRAVAAEEATVETSERAAQSQEESVRVQQEAITKEPQVTSASNCNIDKEDLRYVLRDPADCSYLYILIRNDGGTPVNASARISLGKPWHCESGPETIEKRDDLRFSIDMRECFRVNEFEPKEESYPMTIEAVTTRTQ